MTMSDAHVLHATETYERTHRVSVPTLFAAWRDPAVKARWFAPTADTYELDFRVGGGEVLRARVDGEGDVEFQSTYLDIRSDTRIVYTSTLQVEGRLATASLTTVLFDGDGSHSRLLLTEHATFLDGLEAPARRRRGTDGWLDALRRELALSQCR